MWFGSQLSLSGESVVAEGFGDDVAAAPVIWLFIENEEQLVSVSGILKLSNEGKRKLQLSESSFYGIRKQVF